MSGRPTNDIWLDYAAAGRKAKFLPNLSAVAAAGQYLWTASDEVRTIECLAPRQERIGADTLPIQPAAVVQAHRRLDVLQRALPPAQDAIAEVLALLDRTREPDLLRDLVEVRKNRCVDWGVHRAPPSMRRCRARCSEPSAQLVYVPHRLRQMAT